MSGDSGTLDDFTANKIARWLSPLSAGEGQGEGERNTQQQIQDHL
jgi:hypothetical protein